MQYYGPQLMVFNFERTKDKRIKKVLKQPHTYFKFLAFPYKPHTLPLSLRLSVSLILSGSHYRSFICTHLYCPEPVISLFENFSKIFCLIEPPILVCDFLTGQWLTRKRRLTTTAREILIKATCSCFIQPLKIKLSLFKQIRVQNPNWYHRSKFWLAVNPGAPIFSLERDLSQFSTNRSFLPPVSESPRVTRPTVGFFTIQNLILSTSNSNLVVLKLLNAFFILMRSQIFQYQRLSSMTFCHIAYLPGENLVFSQY